MTISTSEPVFESKSKSEPVSGLAAIAGPIKIFIGSSPKNKVEEAVFRDTLLQHASQPLEIYAIDGTTGSATNVVTQTVKQLPENLVGRISGATAFSLARWAIPEWCGYQGRAIYCDSDQMALVDIATLWNYDLSNNMLAAVPFKAAQSKPHYKATMKGYLRGSGDYYLASVMVIDCERAKVWSLAAIVDWIDQQKGAGQVPDVMRLGQDFRTSFQVGVEALSPEWNHLDWLDENSKILHFTDLKSQPWKFHHSPLSDVWERAFLAALERDALTISTVREARRGGYVSRRVAWLPALPAGVRSPINQVWRLGSALLFRIQRLMGRRLQPLRSTAQKMRSRLKRPLNA